MPERMVVIGNLHNKRTLALRRAREKLGLSPAVEISYHELLREGRSGDFPLHELLRRHGLTAGERFWLRLDSPGEQFEVERALIALGAPDAAVAEEGDWLEPLELGGGEQTKKRWAAWTRTEPLSRQAALELPEQTGRLYHPAQWFRGFVRLLTRLEREIAAHWPDACWWNAPRVIIPMMDKRLTCHVLHQAGVPVPPRLADPAEIPDYEALCEQMLSARMHRVFIKLAVGSGACGVMAFQLNPTSGKQQAITTLNVVNSTSDSPVYFSTKKLQKYEDISTLRQLINWLLRQGAHVERWIAKAGWEGQAYDIRQLVVDGGACHRVARISGSPITNLHLRNRRMSPEELKLPAAVLAGVSACAEQAVRAFSHAHVAGVDVLLSRHTYRPFVVDVNPFGDLLYDITHQGCDTYEWEMKTLCPT